MNLRRIDKKTSKIVILFAMIFGLIAISAKADIIQMWLTVPNCKVSCNITEITNNTPGIIIVTKAIESGRDSGPSSLRYEAIDGLIMFPGSSHSCDWRTEFSGLSISHLFEQQFLYATLKPNLAEYQCCPKISFKQMLLLNPSFIQYDGTCLKVEQQRVDGKDHISVNFKVTIFALPSSY